MTPDDREKLKTAKHLLEEQRLASKLAHTVGAPVERASVFLPERLRQLLGAATHEAIWQALQLSLHSLPRLSASARTRARPRLHKAVSAVFGAVSGVFGLPALLIELPASTALMLRSIAEIARTHGEDLTATETQLACVEVFALGGFGASQSKVKERQSASETGYYATRAALAGAIGEALQHVALRGLGAQDAPALVRFVSTVASRFGLILSDKLALGALPIIGAAGAALTNALFMDHFQKLAEGHFTVRELERRYGQGTVRDLYRGQASTLHSVT